MGAEGGESKSNGCTAECGAQSGRFAGQKGPVGDAGADGGPLNSTQCQLHFFKPPPGTGAGTHGVDAAHLLTESNSWQNAAFLRGIRWMRRSRCCFTVTWETFRVRLLNADGRRQILKAGVLKM